MPFRFRKIISLGKGFRINLSKSGLSASIGRPGSSINLGKRGIRGTIGAPGSGLSYSQQLSAPQTNNPPSPDVENAARALIELPKNCLIAIISLVLICLITFCCFAVIFSASDGISTPTATPISKSFNTIVVETAQAAQRLTMSPASPTQYISQPTSTLAATFTPIPSQTPFIFAAPPPSNYSDCSCSGDTLNCSNFSRHSQAQACFESCRAAGAGDIHKLDEDNDGNVCESLP